MIKWKDFSQSWNPYQPYCFSIVESFTSLYLIIYIFIYLHICLSIYLISLSIYLSNYLSNIIVVKFSYKICFWRFLRYINYLLVGAILFVMVLSILKQVHTYDTYNYVLNAWFNDESKSDYFWLSFLFLKTFLVLFVSLSMKRTCKWIIFKS